MDWNTVWTAVGSVIATLSFGGIVIRASFRTMLNEATRANDIASAKRNTEIDAELKAQREALADMERRKLHTKANHESVMQAQSNSLENLRATVQNHEGRIIGQEKSTVHIEAMLARFEAKLDRLLEARD